MTLQIRFETGEIRSFDDRHERVSFGRAGGSDVVFPRDDTRVGRTHCALRRIGVRYRLELPADHVVLIDGAPAWDGEEIEGRVELQFGPGGPRVHAEVLPPSDELPPTNYQGRRPAVRAQLEEVTQRGQSTRRLAIGGVALLAVLTVIALAQQSERIRVQEVEVGSLKDAAIGSVASVRLKHALQHAMASTYLVALRDEHGGIRTLATAWVAGEDVLATNAHVAEAMNEEVEQGRSELIVRSSSDPPVDVVVQSVAIHPGYWDFQRLYRSHCPEHHGIGENRERFELIDACDVALLRTERGSVLGQPLTPASQADLAALEVGDPIGFVGYPMEGLIGALNPDVPHPIAQLGHVIGLADFFFARGDAATRQLVKHNIPSTGGASGSPILNADGKVIGLLSAGNVAGLAQRGRIPSAALVNFAQRADLLQELLDGNADVRQAERTRRWEVDLGRYSSCRVAPQEFWDAREHELARAIYPRRPQRVHGSTLRLSGDAPAGNGSPPWAIYSATARVTLPAEGEYRILAYAPRGIVGLRAVDAESSRQLAIDDNVFYWSEVVIETHIARTVVVHVFGPEAIEDVDLRAFTVTQPTSDEALAQLEADFRDAVAPSRPGLVREVQGRLSPKTSDTPAASRFKIDLSAPGIHMLAAVSEGRHDLDLAVLDESGQQLDADDEPDWFPAVIVRAPTKTLSVYVVGEHGGDDFVLRIYEAR